MVRRKSQARRSADGQNKASETLVVKRRVKSGVRALREIRKLRKSTNLLIPRLPFSRLVREIMYELFPRAEINRIQHVALEALREACEMYIVQFFEDSYLLSLHCNRVTLMVRDMVLMRRLRGRDDVINR